MHEIVNEEFAERERKADMHCEMASQLRQNTAKAVVRCNTPEAFDILLQEATHLPVTERQNVIETILNSPNVDVRSFD